MGETSQIDCQIWFPGDSTWELWRVRAGKSAEILKTAEVGEVLLFERKRSLRELKVLALPVENSISFPFISTAADSDDFQLSAKIFVEKQKLDLDSSSVLVEPVAGSPPKTVARIDAYLDRDANYKNRVDCGQTLPDLIVPSALLQPLKKRSITLRQELGQTVVIFERNGRVIHYDLLTGKGDELFSELLGLQQGLEAKQLIAPTIEYRLWSDTHIDAFEEEFDKFDGLETAPTPRLRSDHYTMDPGWVREQKQQRASVRSKQFKLRAVSVMLGILGLILIGAFAIQHIRAESLKGQIAELCRGFG